MSPDVACGRAECDLYTCLFLGEIFSTTINFTGCSNIKRDSELCSTNESNIAAEVVLRTGRVTSRDKFCNGLCDDHFSCEDEAECGGFTYGAYCRDSYTKQLIYLNPHILCNFLQTATCEEPPPVNCTDLTHSCEKFGDLFKEPSIVPILNNTRCGAPYGDIIGKSLRRVTRYVCDNMYDQANCTDPGR